MIFIFTHFPILLIMVIELTVILLINLKHLIVLFIIKDLDPISSSISNVN